MKIAFVSFFCLLCLSFSLYAEDGYRLWLRYEQVEDASLVKKYRKSIEEAVVFGDSPTSDAIRSELEFGLRGILGILPKIDNKISEEKNILIIGASKNQQIISIPNIAKRLQNLSDEGYTIFSSSIKGKNAIIIAGNTEKSALYGVFHFLRLMQSHQPIDNLDIIEQPKHTYRLLNHWDNLDRTVERGYAGFSIWDWHKLPDYVSPQYKDYARANASIGINGTVLTNVNANADILKPQYLEKVSAIANVFRPYGIKVYLTARFSAPVEIGGLQTADPLNAEVKAWWTKKVNEIYSYIPDFGGFLVKANSEGQPGPQDYERNHADGSNMLAEAVEPHGGIVMWRAFVYDDNVPDDRAKQAFNEFKPLDGQFKKNVLVQVKNGAIDFQPREPFHPLFGAMPETPLMMEFQITQEYLGFATHLVYLAPLFKECLYSDTYAEGKGSYVAKIIDGSLEDHAISGMAGVSNIGTDRNWTGHPFGQANWYCFGRLAWDHTLSSDDIAEEWIRMTFSNDTEVVRSIGEIMSISREAAVNYMTPLGLHHQMARGHHYGPGPWVDGGRADWTSLYYHRADSEGIGFDRTKSGSDAVSQYFSPVSDKFNNIDTCPEEYLLWFHHVGWDYEMNSGETLWDELCSSFNKGVDSVKWMKERWNSLENRIDKERHAHVSSLMDIQFKEAKWWRDAMLVYFQTFSKRPIPAQFEQPPHSLEYYMNVEHKYAPGN